MKFSSLMPAGALVIAGVAAGCSGGYSGPSGPDSLRIAAASVHLKGGANSQPTFADNGLSLTTNGALSGLGNVDLLVTLNATANVTANCTNHGGNLPPGQNPAPIMLRSACTRPDCRSTTGRTISDAASHAWSTRRRRCATRTHPGSRSSGSTCSGPTKRLPSWNATTSRPRALFERTASS